MSETSNQETKYENRPLTESMRRRAFAARLEHELRRSHITSHRAARHVGVPDWEIYYWRAGITLPGDQHYRKLSQLLGCLELWLKTGKGPRIPRSFELPTNPSAGEGAAT